MDRLEEQVLEQFVKVFGDGGEIRRYFAPGRVNLIGEHTDYNGGHVFPCALSIGTCAAVRDRSDRLLRFYSGNFPETGVITESLDDLTPNRGNSWTSYPKGVMWAFEQGGLAVPHGFDIAFYGDIPSGAGLSSSAAIEVATGLLIKDAFCYDTLSGVDLARIGQYAENHFNGMNCGIMDQFASAMGKKDHAIFLDTKTLQYEYIPVVLTDETLIITNSNVKHSLVTSAYNERRKECETALRQLQEVTEISALGDLDEERFEEVKDAIKDPVCRKRARHAVTENQRTIRSAEALKRGDLLLFGKWMNESHRSLRDDYEVSCKEIDELVDLAQKMPGVIGSRMTGGGFGGCTVSIVKKEMTDRFVKEIGDCYREKTGLTAEFYVAQIGDGAHIG